MLYTFLDMSQPSVVCLNSLRSAGVGIVGVRSAGIGIAGVGHRSREACLRWASLLVYTIVAIIPTYTTVFLIDAWRVILNQSLIIYLISSSI